MTVEEVRRHLEGEDRNYDNFPVGMRVLAVDDDPICLKLLEGLLRKCQYQGMVFLHFLPVGMEKLKTFQLICFSLRPETGEFGFLVLMILIEVTRARIMDGFVVFQFSVVILVRLLISDYSSFPPFF